MPEHQQTQQSKKPESVSQRKTTFASQTYVSNPAAIIQRARIDPKSLTNADILQLQRTIGNRAVGRLLSEIRSTSTAQQAPVQRQEIPEEEEPLQSRFKKKPEQPACPSCSTAALQRQELEDDEKPLQGKMTETVQRQEIPEEEEPLQGVFEKKPEKSTCSECSTASIQRKEENCIGLPDDLKSGVENLSGIDMSDVRVHYNSSKPAEIGALAYTQGTDIHVAPGQERYLPHEAWHVVQQAKERVKPTMKFEDVSINDNVGLEREADLMGKRAERICQKENSLCSQKEMIYQHNVSENVVQRLVVYSEDISNSVNFLLSKEYAVREARDPVKSSKDDLDFSQQARIAIIAHGGQGHIRWASKETNGEPLNGEKFVTQVLVKNSPKDIESHSRLDLWSCEAGVRGFNKNDSLVDGVKNALKAKGKNVTVTGVNGVHVVLGGREGGSFIPNKIKNYSVQDFYEDAGILRTHYFCEKGVFSEKLREKYGISLRHLTLHLEKIQKYLYGPANLNVYKQIISWSDNLQYLFNEEKNCGMYQNLEYAKFEEDIKTKLLEASEALMADSIFIRIMKKVNKNVQNPDDPGFMDFLVI